MIINHNLLAENAKRQSNITGARKKKSTERLSSGYRINRSADDAAGLSISEKMRGQIRGLTRASQNVQDGISFVQTGDGALEEVHSMLQRIRELAVQSSNDTNTDEDRMDIDQEVQQLKKEMNRVFNDTEFNTMPIFKAPYIPDIEGMPNDFEMYNAPDGYGVSGILINNKRYTMDELGCPNSYEHGEWEKKFYDDNGELIHLKLAADAPVYEMHRVYTYEADDTGIKINNLYATTWDKINKDGDTYSFYYHGMDISFTTDAGDTQRDVIKKFNGEGMAINSFDAIPSGISLTNSAVAHNSGAMYIYVNKNNKDSISSWTYKMVADDEGLGLVQTSGSDGILHTKTKWSDFSGNSSGDYPIVDWGTTGETTDAITLASTSYGAHYMYKDNASSSNISSNLTIPIDFNVDEISKNQAKIALTYDLIGNGIDAPIRMVSATEGTQVKEYANFDSFEFQRDKLLRNFGSSGSDSPMKIEVKRTMNVVGTQTDYKQVGSEWVVDNTYDVCVYSYSAVNSAGDEIMTATSGEFLNTGLSDGEITLHSSRFER